MKYQKLLIGLIAVTIILSLKFAYASNSDSDSNGADYEREVYDDTSEDPKGSVENNDKDVKANSIKVALLLDTSSSMSGLIEQAKSQLWQILNHLGSTEKEGDLETALEVALYEYGNTTYARGGQQIRKLSGFTTDMDNISAKLFALSTSGGEEYCGEVIETSLSELEWGQNDNDLKMIYIAGNEPFSQGPVNYAEACLNAKKSGVVVNTIFCGNEQTGIQTFWKQGADITDGSYMNIDQNRATVYVETPYDKQLVELNSRLNQTYVPYGKKGKSKMENLREQDKNANSYSLSNMADRTKFKSSKKYKSDDWDLVDAYEKDKNIVNEVEGLTDTLQNISVAELELRIQEISTERAKIQEEINQANIERLKFIEENEKSTNESNDLKLSIKNSVEKQAKKKGFKIQK